MIKLSLTKRNISVSLLFCACSLSGCVGDVTHSVQTQISTQICPEQGAGNLAPCSAARAATFSEEQVLSLWGKPSRRGATAGQDYLTYESADRAEHGATIFVVIPIPLDVPYGHYETTFYFARDKLVQTSWQSDADQGIVCGPAMMFEGPDASPCVH